MALVPAAEPQPTSARPGSSFDKERNDAENSTDTMTDIEKDAAPLDQTDNGTEAVANGAPAAQAQDWNGPDDPGNPQNWSFARKAYQTAVVGFLAFAIIGSSIYTPGYADVKKDFHVGTTAAFVPFTVFVLGLAFGPVIAAPISETFGRRIVYLTTFPPTMFFTLGSGFAQNFGTLIVCRFFAGTFSAPSLAIGAGSISDMYLPIDRAASSGLWMLLAFMGPVMGPPIASYAAMIKGWRWTQWVFLFICIPIYIFSLFQSETYKRIILQKRARKLGVPPPPSPLPEGFARVKFLLLLTVRRPIHMLVTEPIVIAFAIYVSFNFAILYGFFAAFPAVFEGTYGFNTGESGLVFIAIAIGNVIGYGIFVLVDRKAYRPLILAAQARGDLTAIPPEARLYSALIGAVLLPISLFWFAWTARPSIHWICPIIASIPFATGNALVFFSAMLYMIDTYGALGGASAVAANGILRYGLGAGFPLFIQQMCAKLGVDWATSLFGFISILLCPIPWLLIKWGPALRNRSSYIPKHV